MAESLVTESDPSPRSAAGGHGNSRCPTLNFNVGVLGHVDSGKTSLVKVLSTVASTACFDKNPQSQERGITLDLGFSSFCVDLPEHLKMEAKGFDQLQFTLVDCPGHASLIRTVIGGAQIIDLMMLIVDVTKGVQVQTAECLVIGEITCDKMIVVLNKVDLLPADKRKASIERMMKRLQKTLEATKFAACPIISVAARPGGSEASDEVEPVGVNELIDTLKAHSYVPSRVSTGPFMFAVDHCFSIKGQGTVMTGTVVSGSASVNDSIEIPALKVSKKIKSMQMFKKPVNSAMQGDRVGICVTQFDPKQLERGLVCSSGALSLVSAAIVKVSKISYFKTVVGTKAKFHITMGHATLMGRGTFFGKYLDDKNLSKNDTEFDYSCEYLYQDELYGSPRIKSSSTGSDEGQGEDKPDIKLPDEQFALLEFDSPIPCSRNFLVIGSKLDTDIHANSCRIAFHGRVTEPLTDQNYASTLLPRIKIFKNKRREGLVERKVDDQTLICYGLFKKETDINVFVGLKISLSLGETGYIEGGFGQTGKFKVRIPGGLGKEASQILDQRKEKKGKGKSGPATDSSVNAATNLDSSSALGDQLRSIKVFLEFKRYIFDPHKKMIQ